MDENGWEYGQDDEELFELAMHPEQYRNYKSGQAKKNFLADLQKAKDAKLGATMASAFACLNAVASSMLTLAPSLASLAFCKSAKKFFLA